MDKKSEMLHKLCEALTYELEEYSKKIEKAEKMSAGDLEAVDKLSHALKSIKTTIAMMDSDDGYSGRYMPYWAGGMSYADGMRGGSRNTNNMGRSSYARDGRGRGNNPTGRNQYSRDGGYSYDDEFSDALTEAMDAAPNDQIREKLRRIMAEM